MTTKRYIWIVLILASCCRLFAADPNAWEKLNLSSVSIAGATVYYEKSFEPKLPIFEREYKKFLAEKERGKAINAQKNQIIADINKILGITEPDIEKQDKLLTGLLGAFSIEKTTFYIVLQDTTKDFLYEGGQLPNFTYDKASDTATYNPEFKTTSEDGPIKDFEIAFPIASDETFEKDVSQIFQALQGALGSGKLSIAIHEVVESSLLNRARPTDPYWRWFSDGFANAITIEILKKYTGAEDAEEFAKAYDVNEYKELEKEINLRYWMGLNFCIKTPLEYESELRMARYTYATYEAQRLIEKHGFDCVRKILDEVCSKKTRTGQDILQAIKKVTGEDMEARLARYQTFESRKEGMAKYASLFNAATEKRDYEQMLINVIRLLELQDSQFSSTSLQMRQKAALWLFKLSYEEAGDEAMVSFMEELKRNAPQELYDYFSSGFVIYALECNNPRKAQSAAERILKKYPDHPPALTVRMQLLADEGKLAEAKKIAQRICALVKEEQSLYYKSASDILAIEPNQRSLTE